jgi:hypothetical protein
LGKNDRWPNAFTLHRSLRTDTRLEYAATAIFDTDYLKFIFEKIDG